MTLKIPGVLWFYLCNNAIHPVFSAAASEATLGSCITVAPLRKNLTAIKKPIVAQTSIWRRCQPDK